MRPLRAALVTLAIAGMTGARATLARPFTLEDVIVFRTIEEIRVSPDGRSAVFTVRAANLGKARYETDLFFVRIDDARPGGRPVAGATAPGAGGGERQLTFASGDDESPRWSPDGSRIAFISERPGRGGEPAPGAGPGSATAGGTGADDAGEATRQVWAMPADGGEAAQVTAHPAAVAAFEWSPDGKRILFLAPAPKGDDDKRRDKEKDDGYVLGRQWRNHRIWLQKMTAPGASAPPAAAGFGTTAPAAAGVGTTALTDGTGHVQKAAWSPDGRFIAWIESPTPEADADEDARLRVIDIGTGAIVDVPSSSKATVFAWSPDGTRLAFAAPFDGRGIGRADLHVWAAPEAGGGAPRGGSAAAGGMGGGTGARVRNLTAGIDRDIEEISWSPDGRAVDALHSRGVLSVVARVRTDAGANPGVAAAWTPDHAIEGLQRAGDRWVYVRGALPPEVWIGSATRAPRALTGLNAAAATAIDLPVTEPFRWDGPRGTIEGVLYRPAAPAEGRRLPLILRPHGGPRSHTTLDFDPQSLYLAARGFLVLRPNFRGSTGYGDLFTRGNVDDWGDGPLADVMSGADALIARGRADPQRLFLYGWSYGGYLANWAMTHTDRLRAVASGAGVADLRMQYVLSDSRRWRFDYFGGSPFAGHLATFERLSPITYAADARAPALFLVGEEDIRCPPEQSVMMYRALVDRGVPARLVLYPREGHGFSEPRHILDRIRRVAEWFETEDHRAE